MPIQIIATNDLVVTKKNKKKCSVSVKSFLTELKSP